MPEVMRIVKTPKEAFQGMVDKGLGMGGDSSIKIFYQSFYAGCYIGVRGLAASAALVLGPRRGALPSVPARLPAAPFAGGPGRVLRGSCGAATPLTDEALALDSWDAAEDDGDVLLREELHIENLGSREDPVLFAKDIDGHRGARVGAAVLRGLFSAGLALPEPDGRRKKRGRLQRSEGLRAGAICRLADNFVESSAERFQGLDLLENVLVELPEDRWDNIEIVARTANDKPIKRHVDNGTRCHALLIINLGLTSHNMFWPAGGEEVSVMLRSGDAVLFDGKSEHAAPEVMENSSPFPAHPWAGSRRLGVLLRQNIPPGGPRPKRCGAARARLRRAR